MDKILPGKKTIQSPGKTNSLREAILFDHTSDVGITIWGGIDAINWRRQKVRISNLNLKNFFGKKLSTTPTTTAIISDEIEEMPILSDDVIKNER